MARFVAQGLSNKEVAAQLYLSPRTIDAHLRNAFAKLGVTSRTQLARLHLEERRLGDGSAISPMRRARVAATLGDMITTSAASDSLARYYDDASRYPLLGRAEEIRLAGRAQDGDEAARRRLIESNLRLVVAIARRYRGQGLDLVDLVQEGNLGLMAAAERYDRPHELRFAAFAAWWIRRAICRALSTSSRAVRLPLRVVEHMSAVRRVEEELMQRLGRPPTSAELAREAGVGEDVVEDLRRAEHRPSSFSQPAGADGDATLGDLIPDEGAPDPAAGIAEAQERAGLAGAVRALGERPRRVLELRYGIDGEARTLDGVARELGISRERVRTIEAAALRQLSVRPELAGLRRAA